MVVYAAAVIAALYYGQDLIVPLALAVLISFLLTHPVNLLERLKLGNGASVLAVMVITFSLGGFMIWIAAGQLAQIIIRLPQYQQNIQAKIEGLQHFGGGGAGSSIFGQAFQSITTLTHNFSQPKPLAQPGTPASQEPGTAPVPVRIVKESAGVYGVIGDVGASVAHILLEAAAVIILTLFILLNRDKLRNRLFRLFGSGRINLMTTALDDAAKRVSRYLLTQGMVNAGYGLLLGLGLYLIGVPYAAFWGFVAVFLRFIPYLGTFIAGMAPFVLSLAVFDGWRRPAMTLALFVLVEGIISGLVEPWLYSTKTGISSLAILISATFWTLVWGPIGLVMSTPLTVLLVVLGRHVPQFEFLDVLLGDEPVLAPEAHYYQRLLAFDDDEAHEVAETFAKDKPIVELYDSLLIPALALAEADRHDNELDEQREKFIYQSTRELIDDFNDKNRQTAPTADALVAPKRKVLCVPARDEADELVASMLSQSLREAGYDAQSIRIGFVDEMLDKAEQAQPDVLFISALPPFAVTHARSLCRKAKQRCERATVVVALWGAATDRQNIQDRLGSDCAEYLVHSIAEAELQLRLLAGKLPNLENPPESATETLLAESTK